MSGALNNQPAEIVAKLLRDFNLATLPTNGLAWPGYANSLPDSPDNALVVRDSDGVEHGRTHTEGETQEHYGVQIDVRGPIQREVRQRIQHIARVFDTQVLRTAVTLGSYSNLVQALTRTSNIIFVGNDEVSRRKIYTVNFLASLYMLSAENFGTGS